MLHRRLAASGPAVSGLAAVLVCLALPMLAACDPVGAPASDRPESALDFPAPDRPVAAVVSNQFSNEDARDERNEAQVVMDLADIRPGMTIADIGAGEGYYTVRLAERVGADGRVLAQDISREALDRLGRRVERERLETSRSSSATPTTRSCRPTVSTGSSWSTCTTR